MDTPEVLAAEPPAFTTMTIDRPAPSQKITALFYASVDSHHFSVGVDYLVESWVQTIVINNGVPFAVSQYPRETPDQLYGFALEDGRNDQFSNLRLNGFSGSTPCPRPASTPPASNSSRLSDDCLSQA